MPTTIMLTGKPSSNGSTATTLSSLSSWPIFTAGNRFRRSAWSECPMRGSKTSSNGGGRVLFVRRHEAIILAVANEWRSQRGSAALTPRPALLNRPPVPSRRQQQIARRCDLGRRQRLDGRGEIRGRHRHRQPRADLGGAALLGRSGGNRDHLAGGPGF